jgi:hypothetical protein
MNLYAYAGGDPVNFRDPMGMAEESTQKLSEVLVIGNSCADNILFCSAFSFEDYTNYMRSQGYVDYVQTAYDANAERTGLQQILDEVVVTARRTGTLQGIKIDFRIPYPLEQLWIVTNDGGIIYVPTKAEKYKDSCGNTLGKNSPDGSVEIPNRADIFAVIHTHPSWGYAWPAAGDYTSAQNFSVYNINSSGTWVLRKGAARGSAPTALSGATPAPPPSGRGTTCI